jgi:hypothetical protein
MSGFRAAGIARHIQVPTGAILTTTTTRMDGTTMKATGITTIMVTITTGITITTRS